MDDNFLYTSVTRLEFKDQLRHAYLGQIPVPVVYGVQGDLKKHYGVGNDVPELASTLDHIIAAVGG
jgi:hypothetical protein